VGRTEEVGLMIGFSVVNAQGACSSSLHILFLSSSATCSTIFSYTNATGKTCQSSSPTSLVKEIANQEQLDILKQGVQVCNQ
jgi:hypothetical protein